MTRAQMSASALILVLIAGAVAWTVFSINRAREAAPVVTVRTVMCSKVRVRPGGNISYTPVLSSDKGVVLCDPRSTIRVYHDVYPGDPLLIKVRDNTITIHVPEGYPLYE